MSWHHEHDHWEDQYYTRYPPAPPSPPRRYPSATRPAQQNPFRRSDHLSPEPPFNSSLHRSRSYGHGPRPEINIYNYQDQQNEQAQRAPAYPPAPSYPPAPAYPPAPSPVMRGRKEERLGDRLVDDLLAAEVAEMRLDRLARSRSRGKSDAPMWEHPPRQTSPNYYKWQLEQKEKELKEAEQKRYWDKEQERMRIDFELKRSQDEEKRRLASEAADEERKRIILAHEKAMADRSAQAKEEERRVLEKIERDKKAAAEEERRLIEKLEKDRRLAKEAEEKQWKEFEQKQKAKQEEAERLAKAEKEKIDNEMRNRLLKAGYSLEQAEAMLDPAKAKKEKKSKKEKREYDDEIIDIITVPPTNDMALRSPAHVPVFAKIHKKYLDIETLRYYQIPYEYDRANPDYLIILQEMDKEETDVLFEHTRRLRKGKLLLEPAKKDKKEFAWVRKRDRSKSIGRRDIRLVEVRK